jgi:hypothetical protein
MATMLIPKFFEEIEDSEKKRPFVKMDVIVGIKHHLLSNPSSILTIFDIKKKFGHDLSVLKTELSYLQTDKDLHCYLENGYKWCFTLNNSKISYNCKEKMLQFICRSPTSIRIDKKNGTNYYGEIFDLYRLVIFGSVYGKDCSTMFDKYFSVRKRDSRMFLLPLIKNAKLQTKIHQTNHKEKCIQSIVFDGQDNNNINIQKRIKRGEAVVLVDEATGTYDVNRVNNSINSKNSKQIGSLAECYNYFKQDNNDYTYEIKNNEIPLCLNRKYDKDVTFTVYRIGASQQMRKLWCELSEKKK